MPYKLSEELIFRIFYLRNAWFAVLGSRDKDGHYELLCMQLRVTIVFVPQLLMSQLRWLTNEVIHVSSRTEIEVPPSMGT